MTKISVIVPIYKVEQYLPQCLDSIINQTLADIEILLIDNGASQAEKTIIDSYKNNDNRIRVITFDKNVGYGKAINTGIENVKSKYFAIIESDDFVELNMLEELFNLAEQYNADITKAAYYEFDSKDKKDKLHDFHIQENVLLERSEYLNFFTEHPSIWSCLYNKEFITSKNIKLIEREGTAWVDNAFQIETFYLSNRLIYTSKTYYHYRINRDHSSSSLEEGINVPYICILDIENVIKNLNINNSEMSYYLSKKIISYIKCTAAQISFKNYSQGIKAIQGLGHELVKLGVNNNKFKYYKSLEHRFFATIFVLKKTISKILKSIFFIQIKKKEITIKVFNKKIYEQGE